MSTKKILIGFLLLGALIIFALATFYIENWQFYVQDGYKLHARFPRALELSAGDEVTVAGVEVGRVHSISVDPQREHPVEVVMWIRKDTAIRENDRAIIKMRSIFGGSFLEIERVDRDAPLLADGNELRSTMTSKGIPEIIAKSDEVLDEALETVEDSRVALRNFAMISERLKEGKGTVGKLLVDDSAYENLQTALKDAGSALDGVAKVTDNLLEGKGVAGRLLVDDTLGTQFEDSLEDIGQFARLLGDISDDFQHSSLGRLVSDDEFYQSANKALKDLQQAMAAVAESRGTVGKLINDPELYEKVNATVDGVQEIINEYREQSPILTFTGAVFGAM